MGPWSISNVNLARTCSVTDKVHTQRSRMQTSLSNTLRTLCARKNPRRSSRWRIWQSIDFGSENTALILGALNGSAESSSDCVRENLIRNCSNCSRVHFLQTSSFNSTTSSWVSGWDVPVHLSMMSLTLVRIRNPLNSSKYLSFCCFVVPSPNCSTHD